MLKVQIVINFHIIQNMSKLFFVAFFVYSFKLTSKYWFCRIILSCVTRNMPENLYWFNTSRYIEHGCGKLMFIGKIFWDNVLYLIIINFFDLIMCFWRNLFHFWYMTLIWILQKFSKFLFKYLGIYLINGGLQGRLKLLQDSLRKELYQEQPLKLLNISDVYITLPCRPTNVMTRICD